MSKKDEVVQVSVAGATSAAGEIETLVPSADSSVDQTVVVTEQIPSDNLNEAVTEKSVDSESPVAADEMVDQADERGSDVAATESVESASDESVTTDSAQPESKRPLTGEEIQAARQAESKPLDKDVVALMQNATVHEVTPLAKAALARHTEFGVELAMYLARVDKAIDEKSFRVWIKKVLEMDEKLAYNLRAIGVVFWPLVTKHCVTNTYLAGLGTSRLLTIVRFPEKTWRVTEVGQLMVKDGDTERHIADMSVEELRKLLATIKAAKTEPASTLELWLKSIEVKCASSTGLLPDYEAEVAPIKNILHPKVQEWSENISQSIKSNDDKQNALLAEYRKKIENLKTEKEALKAEQKKASWWLDLLEGRGNDLPAEFAPKATAIAEDAADC